MKKERKRRNKKKERKRRNKKKEKKRNLGYITTGITDISQSSLSIYIYGIHFELRFSDSI